MSRRAVLGAIPAEIASAIVYALPGRATQVREALDGLPGVEVHAQTPEGRFIVTVEDVPGASAGDTLLALHRIEDVVSAALVSHYVA